MMSTQAVHLTALAGPLQAADVSTGLASVGEVLQAAASAHAALGGVLAISTILLDGRPVGAGVRLSAGTTLDAEPLGREWPD